MRMTVNSAHGGVRYEPHLRSYHKVWLSLTSRVDLRQAQV
jgi:hypothetical protein